jgi:hypothetical protein
MAALKRVENLSMKHLEELLDDEHQRKICLVDSRSWETNRVNGPSIFAVDNWSPEQLLDFALRGRVYQLCQIENPALANELNLSALMLRTPEIFLAHPLSSILSPLRASRAQEKKLTKLRIPFRRADEKMPSLEKFRQLLIAQKKPESLIGDVLLVADEMYTNAVFNAPFVDPITGYNPGIDRSDITIKMDSSQSGELLIGFDQDHLAIVCRDPYGSLDVRQYFRRILECFRKGVSATMRMGEGGAGIGSYMVYNMAVSLSIGVKKGDCTVIGVTIPWSLSGRRRAECPKNLHYFAL